MREFFKTFLTRWQNIAPDQGYRLACANPECSLSCANLKKGKISVTSIHGDERHSYTLSDSDMMFATLSFLNHLSEFDIQMFVKMFNELSPNLFLSVEKTSK